MRFRIFPMGSQKFFQKLIDSPFFPVHFRPWTYIGPPFLQAAHIFQQGSFLPSSVNLFGDKYLAAIILAHGVSSSFASLQQSEDNRARFLHLVWNSPSPPNSFGKVTICQFTMCIFLFSTVDPHRKSLIALLMALYTLMGRAWHCMQQSAIGAVAAWRRTSLLALDRSVVFHPTSLPWIVSTIKLEAFPFLP